MPLDLSPIELKDLSPTVARVVGPEAPLPAKMMAAKGLVPMGPQDLLTVLYQLSRDSDPKVAEAALDKSKNLPDAILGAAIHEPLHPRVLHFFSELTIGKPKLVEKILLNHHTHDETFVFLASKGSESILEIIATNQERVLRHPTIIEAIYFNKAARMSTVERLLELAVRNKIQLEAIPQFKEMEQQILGTKPSEVSAQADALFSSALNQGWEEKDWDKEVEATMTSPEEASQAPLATTEKPKEELNPLKITQQTIMKMSLLQKIRLASVGSPMHRALLIRDSNRLVAIAAIQAEGVSEQEAIQYSSNRSLPEEVIREIAKRKDWLKNYAVKVNLLNNPKCPLSQAMHFLPHLRSQDLRALSRSKNIPSALVQAAKQALNKRS